MAAPLPLAAYEAMADAAMQEASLSQPQSGWRPIDSAPRDGSFIDLWEKTSGRRPNCFWSDGDGLWGRKLDSTLIKWQLGCYFTHWMPIPAPPDPEPRGDHRP